MASVPTGPRPARDQGAGALEYVGILLALSVLVAALVAVLAPGPVATATRAAVCSFLAGPGCGGGATSADGGQEQGAGTGGGAGAGTAESGSEYGGDNSEDSGEDGGEDGGGDEPFCEGFLGCVGAGLRQGGSAVVNVGRGAWDDVTGIVDVVTDPGKLVDGVRYIVDNPGDAARQMVWDDESAGMWDEGDYGGAVGRTVWNVGSWFIPGANVGKAGSIFGDLGRVGRLADDLATVVRKVDDALLRGDLDEAADLAADARRQADDLEDAARRDGCLTAGLPGGGLVLASGGGRGSLSVVVVAAGQGCGDDAREADEVADAAEEAVQDALSDGASRPSRGIPPGLERGELGLDPKVARFRQGEYDTALRVEGELGVTLQRATSTDPYDWVGSDGRTYDAVGNFPAQYFDRQWPVLQGRIVDHLEKADVVPVDVTQFTAAQTRQVRDYVDSLPRAQRDRITIVGGG